MKVKLLDAGEEDLLTGYEFYEKQKDGLGNYF